MTVLMIVGGVVGGLAGSLATRAVLRQPRVAAAMDARIERSLDAEEATDRAAAVARLEQWRAEREKDNAWRRRLRELVEKHRTVGLTPKERDEVDRMRADHRERSAALGARLSPS